MMAGDKVIPLNAWKGKLDIGKQGPKKTVKNLLLHIRNLPGLGKTIRLNDFTGRVEWNGETLRDEHIIDIRVIIEEAGFDTDRTDVRPAVERVALENTYDPIRDYLDGLKWDDTPRLDTWLRDYMGAPDHPVIGVFGAKFLIGAVARVYDPGCQMDNMLVLEGKQGAGKTTACAALFGRDYMISSISDFKSKEASIALQGRWVVEVAELAALNKTDVRDVKKFITETVDQYRPVHGRSTIDRPRRCVFVGTTNEHQYLKDATGNRRFWPVPCGEIKVEAIREVRDALWAEAVARFRAREPWWLTDETHLKAAEAAQADRSQEDPWGEVIERFLNDPERRLLPAFTSADIMTNALRIPTERQETRAEMRVGDIMRRLKWNKVRSRKIGDGKRVWAWERPE
ncbi:COG5545 Predicted P-loop ATPase and inactivated derivatives [uncultured Caudovirales phage]|uniref:COG5545 Predicted P-loop ATPase and inactivated derivatives n=1 Tax=uncultured Caudovirales phage TaxID=2100421 RepID=A0A6J5M5C3_9CAUD|nr:COG5545 Predicted P-loop ATPase and inactivated derivatives [uncultured Caudovirales phage]